MGTSSSQPLQSQTQNLTQTPDLSQDTVPQLDGAGMDDPAERDDTIHVREKRKSADATLPLKRSRQERESARIEAESFEVKDSQDAIGNATEQATEDTTQKPRKKKSKREHPVREEGEAGDSDILATQSSMLLDQTPQATADTINGDSKKRSKTKRKRATGRPSGLNILPAGMSDPITQEDSAMVGTVLESPEQPTVVAQVKPKKSKDSTRVSGHPSPEMTNAQSSQPALHKTKSPKAKKTLPDGTSPAAVKSPKASRKRKPEVQEDTDVLPTPPEATQVSKSKPVKASKQPAHDQEADDGALRDDYSEVDATGQVEGWLSSQLTNGNSPTTPRVDTLGSTLRKKAAVNASVKREKAQRSEDRETAKKRRRESQYLENDKEDYVPAAQTNVVVAETPVSTGRSRRKRANEEMDVLMDEPATQDVASPLVSKKARSASNKTAKPAKKSTLSAEKRIAEPATPIARASRKKKRDPKPTDDEDDSDDPIVQTNDEDTTENQAAATKAKKTKTASKAPSTSEKSARNPERCLKGPLTWQEKDMVDKLFQETMDDTGMTDAQLRNLIKSWKTASEFKEAVEEALPDRPIAAIRKFCQRRYHNMERGAWSPEDDASLRKAHAAHPDKWTEISALVGRTASDCKDRWKNTVSIQETLQLGPWSQDETAALVKAVETCIKELKKANKEETKGLSRAELERMLSWSEVAKKLGGTRSAKRCNEKWQKLKRGDGDARASVSAPAPPLANGLDRNTSSKRLREIETLYNQCDVGDLYDILTEIHTALPDPNRHFEHESTLWSVIATKNPGSRFKSAMRRRGLYDAADVYKAEIGEEQTIAGKAKVLADFLESQWGLAALAKKRSFVPKPKADKFKSAEKVDSDEEDEVVDDEDVAEEEEVVEAETETPPTSNGDDEDDNAIDDRDEIASEHSSEAEIPDSQTQPVVNGKRSDEDFAFSFKPINKKRKEPSPVQEDVESDVVEQLHSSIKRKKSSKRAKAKA
jgi:hypothetical protein